MSVDNKVSALYDYAIHDVTRGQEQWKSVCRMIGQLYRYEFDNILMVYMQRPRASLVADYDTWKKVGRYVKRGSKGIAIFPSRALSPEMRYVFDISDTGGRNSKLTWEMTEENRDSYAAFLRKKEGIKDNQNESTLNFLKAFTEKRIGVIIESEFGDEVTGFTGLTGTKRNMVEGSDTDNELGTNEMQGVTAAEVLKRSIMYAVFLRCGFDIPAEKQDFSFITAYSSEEEIYRLGSLVSDISCNVLRSIAKELNEMERMIAYERDGKRSRDDVQGGSGWDALSRFGDGTEPIHDESGEIRSQGDGIPDGELQGTLPDTHEVRHTGTEDADSGRRSQSDDGDTRGGLSEKAPASRSQVHDGDVGAKRAGEDAGGRDRDGGNSNEVSLKEKSKQGGGFEQASFFVQDHTGQISFGTQQKSVLSHIYAEEAEGKYTYLNPKKELVIPHDFIKEVLLRGSNIEGSKKRIYEMFEKISDPGERAKALKKEYGQGGSGWPLEGYGLHGYDTFGKGIRFQWRDGEGEKEGYLNWKAAEREIKALILSGKYFMPAKKYDPDQVSAKYLQEPMDNFFRKCFWAEIPKVLWYEVFVQDIPKSDKAAFLAGILRSDRYEISIRNYFSNQYGECRVARGKDGLEAEFHDEAGTKWKIELDWWECADYLSDMIKDGSFKPEYGIEDMETLLEDYSAIGWIQTIAREGIYFLSQSPQERQDERVSRLKQVLNLLEINGEIKVAWDGAYDEITASDGTRDWRGREFYKHLWEDVIIVDEKGNSEIIGKELLRELRRDMAVSRHQGKGDSFIRKKFDTQKVAANQDIESTGTVAVEDYLWQEPLKSYFNEEIQYISVKVLLYDVLTTNLTIKTKAEFLQKIYGEKRDGFFMEEAVDNLYGACRIVRDAAGISISYPKEDGTVGEVTLDYEYCASLILHMIEENEYLSEGVFERLQESKQSFIAMPWFMDIYHEYQEKLAGEADFEPVLEEFEVKPEIEMEKEPALDPVKRENPKIEENYHLSSEELPKGGAKTRYKWNVDAIRLLRLIESENRAAAPEEQKILARYVGWGGISQAYDERNEAWKNEYAELKSLLSQSEYEAARDSVNTAFYTNPVITESVHEALEQFGFRKGSILEPAMGIGNFFGTISENLSGAKLYGIEKDDISGRIAKLLYPKAEIKIHGFEETHYPDNFFDVAIGNVPFGDYKLYDPKYSKYNFRIHDYFFAKTLDKVRPGGIIAFISSKGTLDKANPAVRKYLAERAELLGAIRLPSTAFRDSAGTDVTSDIIFLQKRMKKVSIEPDWIHLGHTEDGIAVNSYFVDHPEMMLGKMEYDNRMFGNESKYTSCINHEEDFNLKAALKAAVGNLTGKIIQFEELLDGEETSIDIIDADPDVKNFTFTFVGDNLYYRENSKMFQKEVGANVEERIRYLNEIRHITRQLIFIQTQGCSEQELKFQQGLLHEKYDAYVKKHGYLNAQTSMRAFRDDADYPLLCSLEVMDENGKVEKADMFYKQTILPKVKEWRVETAVEALNISVNEYGGVNIPFMLSIYEPNLKQAMKSLSEGSTLSEMVEAELKSGILVEELEGLIFLDPTEYNENNLSRGWKTADEYLSGNVRDKLRIAMAFAEENGELFAGNAEALKKVQPKDLDASEIDVRIGTTWIEPEDYEQFIYELLNTRHSARAVRGPYRNSGIQVKLNPYNMNWFIENKSWDKGSIAARETYGTKRMDAYSILEESLNLRTVTVRDRVEEPDGKVRYVLNKAETMLAREKQDQMKDAFRNWIFKDAARRQKYVQFYNETFNNIRLRQYDGSHLLFPGMSPEITLRDHQKNAISRILLGGNTLLAHCVGSGKTFTMMAACMEQKRMGLSNKNVIVVPKSLIGQTAGEFMRLYPSANILVATERDFEKSRRKQFVSRIATGDYDCIIMSHSQFEKIPISKERKEKMLDDQIEELSLAIEDLKEQNGEQWTVKQMESQKKKLKEQLKTLADETKKDDLICFEELGIDSIMVDEAHGFKNMTVFSKMNNISGISGIGSKKATDMQLKCQYISEMNDGRGVVFATGTPVSNTMCEMYVMQYYLQKSALERMGIHHFDAWAANFGEVTTALELSVEGSGFRFKSRFNKFTNLPELMTTFKEMADVVTSDMIDLPVPKLKGDKPIIVESEPDWYVKQVMEDFVKRAEDIRNGSVDPSVDNFLKITHEARLLGTDARLLEPDAPNNPEGKLNKVVENVAAEYFSHNKDGNIGCQLVFSDIGTPKRAWSEHWEKQQKSDGEFDIYNYVKTQLVKAGIPEGEIAFIHDAKTDAGRETLFQDMRCGKKKILIGSTDKCGTGVNVQTHLVAMHHIDCPWKPSSIEQRDGRGIRQGNLNDEIAVYRYVTKGTFDAYSWGLVENKQRFISQVMTSRSVSRTCEDVDEATLSYAEIKAVATGNPLIKEKMQLENDVQRLRLLKNSYDSQRYSLEDNFLIRYPKQIATAKEKYSCIVEDMKTVDAALLAEPSFVIQIGAAKYSERVDGGTVMLEAVSKCKNGETSHLGKFKGFELLVEKNFIGVNYMVLRGKTDYKAELSTSPVGNMIKLENMLGGIEENGKMLNERIEQYECDMEQSKVEYEKPFIQEEELKEKTARLNELNVQLDLENKEIKGTDLCEEETIEQNRVAEPKNDYAVRKSGKEGR